MDAWMMDGYLSTETLGPDTYRRATASKEMTVAKAEARPEPGRYHDHRRWTK